MSRAVLIACLVLLGFAGSDSMPSKNHNLFQPDDAGGDIVEPGGTPADAALAQGNPDQYAWQLFAYLNRQAETGVAGVADRTKAPFHEDDDTDTVWESWALASSSDNGFDNLSEVFRTDGARPVCWDKLDRRAGSHRSLSSGLTRVSAPAQGLGLRRVQLPGNPDSKNQEVRINRASFDTIVDNDLYNQSGIEAAVANAQQQGHYAFVNFPSAAKEIKAAWIRLCVNGPGSDCARDEARYHWRIYMNGKAPEVWGLAALHIMTKDLKKNWFFADFIHDDCENAQAPCKGNLTGAKSGNIDTTPTDSKPQRDRSGTRWQYYKLHGTQISFVKDGKDVSLYDPVIEPFPQPTSCMTCHAYASAGLFSSASRTAELQNTKLPTAVQPPSIGVPPITEKYIPSGVDIPASSSIKPTFAQGDFEWSMSIRANPKPSATPANVPHASPNAKGEKRLALTYPQ
jgi:hypothetical protein